MQKIEAQTAIDLSTPTLKGINEMFSVTTASPLVPPSNSSNSPLYAKYEHHHSNLIIEL
jgi:hypothetical protein